MNCVYCNEGGWFDQDGEVIRYFQGDNIFTEF